MSLIEIDAIWLLSLVYLLIRIIASFISFIANSSSCTNTELSMILSSCLTVIKTKNIIKYCETVFERNGENLFWSV